MHLHGMHLAAVAIVSGRQHLLQQQVMIVNVVHLDARLSEDETDHWCTLG